jgi:hypothetical protein
MQRKDLPGRTTGQRMRHALRSLILVMLGATVFTGTAVPSSSTGKQPARAALMGEQALALERADFATLSGIKSYLRASGVDPRGVVIQRGPKNYAGPNCPGPAWNCTTAQKVVQISLRAGDVHDDHGGDAHNRFVCTPHAPETNPAQNQCVIVQNNPNSDNSATCDIETHGTTGTITQTCLITQIGLRNTAFARLVATMNASGGNQDVFQTISARQTSSAGGGNTIDTSQSSQLNSGPESSSHGVTQDVHQINCVNQAASGTGPNVARSHQSQDLDARKTGADLDPAAVDIAQNSDETVQAVCVGPAAPFPITLDHPNPADVNDCALNTVNTPAKESANACSRIHQTSVTGSNTIELGQLDSLFAEVSHSTGDVNVDQGHIHAGTSGTLDQISTANGLGLIDFDGETSQVTSIGGHSTSDFFFVTQDDTGPQCCAAGHQRGNPGSDFDIDGLLTQRVFVDGSSDPDDFTDGGYAQNGVVSGDCETDGTPAAGGGCTVDINATNNADPDGDPASCGPATSCHEDVVCEAFAGEGNFGSCSSVPPEIITFALRRPG